MAYDPHEFVIDLGSVDEPKGGTKGFEIARMAIQHPGWDHTQSQGWFGGNGLVAASQNIVTIELTGAWPTQRHKFMAASLQYYGGETRPGLFVLNKEEDVFDARRNIARK